MEEFSNKRVLVAGLCERGVAAARLLRMGGAMVTVTDASDSEEIRKEAGLLKQLGIDSHIGVERPPAVNYDVVVLSPGISPSTPYVQELGAHGAQILGELEIGFRLSRCLNIAIAGTNGKGTTGRLIENILTYNGRQTSLCGHGSKPICDVVPESKNLDYLILLANALQLETTNFFRPAIAVLMNLTPAYGKRFESREDYVRSVAKMFINQQPFDWAVVQKEALNVLREFEIPLTTKVVTFSSTDPDADIILDRGLITARLPDWSGPLLDMDECRLTGRHNAENIMAALVTGHILRLPLEAMKDVIKKQSAEPDCFEVLAESGGVIFINDSKATNVDALEKALLSLPHSEGNRPNTWLIAGGVDEGQEFHSLGPLISPRLKGAFLVGESRDRIRSAWSLFTPCTTAGSLLEAFQLAIKNAVPGDVVLLSPACSSFDQFRDFRHRGDVFRSAVQKWSGKGTDVLP